MKHNVIIVHNDDVVIHWRQHPIHHSCELDGCVQQSNPQHLPLVQTIASGEGYLSPVGCWNVTLLVTCCQDQLFDGAGAMPGVE